MVGKAPGLCGAERASFSTLSAFAITYASSVSLPKTYQPYAVRRAWHHALNNPPGSVASPSPARCLLLASGPQCLAPQSKETYTLFAYVSHASLRQEAKERNSGRTTFCCRSEDSSSAGWPNRAHSRRTTRR